MTIEKHTARQTPVRVSGFFIAALLCTSLGAMYPVLWFMAPIGLAFYLLLTATELPNCRSAVISGWLYGIVTTASALAWFWNMAPFDWLGSTSYFHGALFAGTIWLATSVLLGSAFGIFGALVWALRENEALPYLIPLLFALTAEISMWLHTIISLGEQSLVEPHFSVLSIGYALAENSYLLQFADSGGVAALNTILAILGTIPLLILRLLSSEKSGMARTNACVALVICLCILCTPLGRADQNAKEQPVDVLVFSADTIATGDKFASLRNLVHETISPTSTKPDLIVFPEGYSLDAMFGTEHDKKKLYSEVFGEHNTLMVYSKLLSEDGIYNVLLFESTTDGLLHTHKKRYLAPEGEYMTYLGKFLISMIPDPLLQQFARRSQQIAAGPEPSTVITEKFTAGGLTCYEIFSPLLYRDLTKKHGANILINSSDPTWFHNSPFYFDKTVQMARVHAVQNRAPVIVANKGTKSYVIDAYGKTMAATPWNTTSALRLSVSVWDRERTGE